MNHKIIKNLPELTDFISTLPELGPNEKYYYSLFARNKYGATEGLKADRAQLKRGTARKEDLINKFKQLETALGTYVTDNNIAIQQDSLVLYIAPNPRNLHKASLKMMKAMVDDIADDKKLGNPSSLALSYIQKFGNKLYYDIDLDFKEGFIHKMSSFEIVEYATSMINESAIKNIIKTHGGYHILVELDKIDNEHKSKWFNNFNNTKHDKFTITMNGDNMIPVPGCVQSNYSPMQIPFKDEH